MALPLLRKSWRKLGTVGVGEKVRGRWSVTCRTALLGTYHTKLGFGKWKSWDSRIKVLLAVAVPTPRSCEADYF